MVISGIQAKVHLRNVISFTLEVGTIPWQILYFH
jgi:hypothetical protein